MENEVLQQILSMLETLTTDVSDLKQGQAEIKLTIENEVLRGIKIIAEGHEIQVTKLDHLYDLEGRVSRIEVDTNALNIVTRDLVKKIAI